MRVLVIGGAGEMGSQAVEDLAEAKDVERVTIADRDAAAAEALAGRCAGKRARVVALALDATREPDLLAAMRDHDVVASALGPFHRFESALVRAAITAGVNYASICDEWQAAEAVLDELDAPARAAGRVVVTGLGASPGISNMTVCALARGLDEIRRADISTFQPLDAGGGEAVLQHLLYIMSGDVVAHRAGKRTLIPACSESSVEQFPEFGPVRVWNMGHSEPATLPRYLSGIREVNFRLGFGRGSGLFVRPASWGFFSTRRRVDLAARALHHLSNLTKPERPGTGAIRVDVWGERRGEVVHRMACGTGEMRRATGLSLSIGVLMLARGQLVSDEHGVFAPEGILDPEIFIAEFRARGMELFSDLEMTRPLVVEPLAPPRTDQASAYNVEIPPM